MTRRSVQLAILLLAGCSASDDGVGGDGTTPDAGSETPGPDSGGGPACTAAEQACQDDAQCCGDLYCANNSLGQVCCGGVGESCATASGTDCCGQLECTAGVCGGGFDPAKPNLVMFPIRGKHNLGYEAPSTGDSTMWTCDAARSNSDFGGDHIGVDIWAKRGTPVVATVDGTLVSTGYSAYSGNKVTVRTDGNWYHFNCHLDSIAPGMVNGKRVKAGDVIGYVGNTGTASNGVVHLHYSIYKDGNYNAGIDPWPYLYAVEWHVCD